MIEKGPYRVNLTNPYKKPPAKEQIQRQRNQKSIDIPKTQFNGNSPKYRQNSQIPKQLNKQPQYDQTTFQDRAEDDDPSDFIIQARTKLDKQTNNSPKQELLSLITNLQKPQRLDRQQQSLMQTLQVKQQQQQLRLAKEQQLKETQKHLRLNTSSSNEEQVQTKLDQVQNNQYYMSKMINFQKGEGQENQFCQQFLEHFTQSFHSLHFCTNIKTTDIKIIKKKQSTVKPKGNKCNINLFLIKKVKKTVVFDLDETLIHCNDNSGVKSDIYLPIVFPHGEIIEAGVNIRPYAVYILSELSKLCEVIVFTASHQCYASKVLDHLDPKQQWIQQRLYRDHCIQTPEQVHIKDLRVLCNDRNLKDIVLIDNAAYSYGLQISNGIPIIPFYDNKNDTELLDLLDYIKYIIKFDDMREVNKSIFKMHLYQQFGTIDEAIDQICF